MSHLFNFLQLISEREIRNIFTKAKHAIYHYKQYKH